MPLTRRPAVQPLRIASSRERVVAASQAPPVVAVRRHGRLRWERGLHGPAAALAPALSAHDSWVTLVPEGHVSRYAGVPRQMASYQLHGLRVDRRVRRLTDLVTGRVLGPALHGSAMPDLPLPVVQHAWEKGYLRMNEVFAAALLDEMSEGPAVVDLQDIALASAAANVRIAQPSARIALQLYSPFPGPALVERLPYILSADLFHGMLACDLVGFQAYRDLAGFAQACSEFLGAHVRGDTIEWEGRTVRLGVYAGTVDPYVTQQQATHVESATLNVPDTERIVAWTGPSDPAAGALGAVGVFGRLLTDDPSLERRVRLVLKVDASRHDPPEHREYLIAVQRAVAALNAERASDRWVPVALDCSPERRPSMAALMRADVLLVNPLADGSALALQRAAVLSSRQPAVVLSRTSGAYERFGDAVAAIDPASPVDGARGLRAALRLSDRERGSRFESIRDRVLAWTPDASLEARIEALSPRRIRRVPALAALHGSRPARGGLA